MAQQRRPNTGDESLYRIPPYYYLHVLDQNQVCKTFVQADDGTPRLSFQNGGLISKMAVQLAKWRFNSKTAVQFQIGDSIVVSRS